MHTVNFLPIKTNKLYQPVVFSVKLIIFALAIYYLYTQFTQRNLDNLGQVLNDHLFTGSGIGLLLSMLVLQFLNYGIENLKWRQILPELTNLSFIKTQKAVYAGNAIALFTPDRLGTFIGRFTYLNEISKTRITVSTFVGNYAQLVTTLLFSLIGLILAWNNEIAFQFPEKLGISTLINVMIIACSLALFVYYQQQFAIELLKKSTRTFIKEFTNRLRFMEKLDGKKLHLILLIAFSRYFVFVLQFYLALMLFGANMDFVWTLSFCGILYLFATLIPSPFMGNLGTREAIGVFLVMPLGIEESVILASLFIWLVNVVLPSIIGGIILLKK